MLSLTQIDRFFTDGFLIVDPDIDGNLLDNIVFDTIKICPDKLVNHYDHDSRVRNAWKLSDSVKQLALHPVILEALESLYLRKPLPFLTLNSPFGTEQAMHADTIHFNTSPANFMCGVTVALEDIDEGNGPNVYCRGSHLLPEYNMLDAGSGTGDVNYRYYEDFVAKELRRHDYQPEPAVMKKGQACITHGNLLQAERPLRDKTRTRHSQLTQYYFDGCAYYNPLWSTPEQIHWHDPEWITHNLPEKKSALTNISRWLSTVLSG